MKEMTSPELQPTLEGMPASPLHQKMAAARLFMPETHGLNEAEMMLAQTPARMAAVWPDNLYTHLVGPAVIVNTTDFEWPGKQAIPYGRGFDKTKIALSGKERLIYGYSFWGLGNRASLRAKGAEEGKYADGDIEAPTRASIHAVEDKIERIETYRAVLADEGILLRKFIEALHPRHIGLQRMGSESAMRQGFEVLTGTIIANMLDAVGDQKGWTPHQQKLAEGAVMARMLADRVNNRHLMYARKLSAMLLSYGQDKSNAFRYKVETGKKYIVENGPKTIV